MLQAARHQTAKRPAKANPAMRLGSAIKHAHDATAVPNQAPDSMSKLMPLPE